MTDLQTLLDAIRKAEEVRAGAGVDLAKARMKLREWGREQVKAALAAKGIVPGKAIVKMRVRKTGARILVEEKAYLLESVGRVDPPTMKRGDLGPNASSTEMWWVAHMNWRNIRKDGTPGGRFVNCNIRGDSPEEIADQITLLGEIE